MSARHRIAVTWLLSSATALADPAPPRPPRPDPPDALLALRDELANISGEEEMARKFDHFRPLCDADGYPLVGNIITKGDGPKHRPSRYCAVVRAKKPKA